MSHLSASSSPPFDSVAILGVGLIGGSIAAAIKKRGLARRVVGVGRSRERLEAARRAGLIDAVETDLASAARKADLFVACTPVDRIAGDLLTAAAASRPGTLLTDVGSSKRDICDALDGRLPREVSFLGSHPLAGSEKQGFEYADADLFENRVCVITPAESSPVGEVERLRRFWQGLGMQVIEMTATDHDRALAHTSHLPHVAAAALASLLDEQDRRLAATGFRDTTRIASGDPDLWAAILLANATCVLEALDCYSRRLEDFRVALAASDTAALRGLLQAAKTRRDGLTAS